MQNFRNYYQILGVARESSLEEIKQAYRRLARQYHPDLNPGNKEAEEKFKDIGEAYDVLSDEGKRSQYDQFARFWKQTGFRRSGSMGRNGRGDRYAADGTDFSEYPDFNTFVDQLLNRRDGGTATATQTAPPRTAPPRTTPPRATTTRTAPPIRPPVNPPPLEDDPYRPGTTKKSYTVGSTASSAAPSAKRRDAEARLVIPLEKAYLGGRERIRLEDGRSLEVNMPSAMMNGQRIRLKGQGVGGGDLFLKIEIEPHPLFQLQGSDVECRIPVTPAEAVLGGAIEVPTLDGLVKMSIPAGVRPGQKLRLAGRGYPVGSDRGDQIVEIYIAVPRDLSPQERDLYEKLRQVETYNPRNHLMA
jgi:curved DNA-binding protein